MLTVSPVHHEWYVGAGGLIARQFAALGAETTFLTAFGATAQATRFAQVLDNDGIGLDAVEVDDRQVFLKSRYLVDDQKVFKVNHGRYVPASTRATEQLIERVDAHLSDHDGLVVTDFGYGLFGPKLIGAIGDLASKHQKPYFVDVSGTGTSNLLKFRRPMVSTPTESELRFACGDQESGLSHLAVNYFERTGAQQLALTLGKRGALLFEPPDSGPRGKRSQAEYLPSMSNHAIDPVGAGDVFLSGVVATNLAGGSQFEGVFLGSCLASLHIARMGNDPTSYAMLTSFLNERAELRG